jgi:hypothetical protein
MDAFWRSAADGLNFVFSFMMPSPRPSRNARTPRSRLRGVRAREVLPQPRRSCGLVLHRGASEPHGPSAGWRDAIANGASTRSTARRNAWRIIPPAVRRAVHRSLLWRRSFLIASVNDLIINLRRMTWTVRSRLMRQVVAEERAYSVETEGGLRRRDSRAAKHRMRARRRLTRRA